MERNDGLRNGNPREAVIDLLSYGRFIVDGFKMNRGTSKAELNYNTFLRQIHMRRPRVVRFRQPSNNLSRSIRNLIESELFKGFSTTCVCVNIGFMLSDHADPDPVFLNVFIIQNHFFFAEIAFENMLNLLGYGPKVFYWDAWKLLDFVIMVGSATSFTTASSKISTGVQVNHPRFKPKIDSISKLPWFRS